MADVRHNNFHEGLECTVSGHKKYMYNYANANSGHSEH